MKPNYETQNGTEDRIVERLRDDITPTEAPVTTYRTYLKKGKLGYQRCGSCSQAVFHPRVICPFCGGVDLAWEESSGIGTVYATTAVAHRGGEPHNVVMVDLDEGFRMMSRVEGVPAEEVRVGERVRFEVSNADEDEPVAVFVREDV